MINYNAALPAENYPASRSGVNVTDWIQGVKGNLSYLIPQVFRGGEQGFVFDPNDLSTMYQDAAGTVPVTAVGQPVGLILDKSKGTQKGLNVVLNGTFQDKSNWGATPFGLDAFSVAAGVATVVASSTSGVTQTIPTEAGKWYVLSLSMKSGGSQVSARAVNTAFNGTVLGETAAVVNTVDFSNASMLFRATSSQTAIYLRNATAGVGYYKDVSVRELPGNHAYQPVSASRPVLHATVNMLFATEDCSSPIWNRTLCTATQVQELAPTGGKPVSLLSCSTDSSTFYQVAQNITSAQPTQYKFSFFFKGQGNVTDDVMSVYVGDADNASLRLEARYSLFNPTTPQVLAWGDLFSVTNTKPVAENAVPVGNGWFRVSLTFTLTAAVNLTVRAQIRRTASVGAPSPCLLWGADLRAVNGTAELPQYQKVVDASNYDTKGFPNYLKFDGVDDFLQTNNIDFTATNEMSLFAGVRIPYGVVTGNTYQAVVELSTNTGANNGAFVLSTPHGAFNACQYSSRGITRSDNVFSSIETDKRVITAKSKISSNLNSVRVNGGVYRNTGTVQGTGNYGNYPLYIGSRAGTTLPFNGHIYGLIGIGKLTSDSETAAIEKELAKRTGVTLNV